MIDISDAIDDTLIVLSQHDLNFFLFKIFNEGLQRLPLFFDQGKVNGISDAQFMRLFKRFVLFKFFSQKRQTRFVVNTLALIGAPIFCTRSSSTRYTSPLFKNVLEFSLPLSAMILYWLSTAFNSGSEAYI
jgi:hypothetical protein